MMIYVAEATFSACPSCYDGDEVSMTVRRAFLSAERADAWCIELEARRAEVWEMFREEYGADAPRYADDLRWEGSSCAGVELED